MGAGIGPGLGSGLNSSIGKREWGSMTNDQIPMTRQIQQTSARHWMADAPLSDGACKERLSGRPPGLHLVIRHSELVIHSGIRVSEFGIPAGRAAR